VVGTAYGCVVELGNQLIASLLGERLYGIPLALIAVLVAGLDREYGNPNYSGVPGGPWPWLESYVRAQKAASGASAV
jgi:hypothetical protein